MTRANENLLKCIYNKLENLLHCAKIIAKTFSVFEINFLVCFICFCLVIQFYIDIECKIMISLAVPEISRQRWMNVCLSSNEHMNTIRIYFSLYGMGFSAIVSRSDQWFIVCCICEHKLFTSYFVEHLSGSPLFQRSFVNR